MKTELNTYRNGGRFGQSFDELGNSRDSFARMRDNDSRKSDNNFYLDQLKQENELFKAKIKRSEEMQSLKKHGIEFNQITNEKELIEEEIIKVKKEGQEQISSLEQQINAKDKEIVIKMAEINAFKKELVNLIGKQEVDKRIKDYVEKISVNDESETQLIKKRTLKLEKELEKSYQELEVFKKVEIKQNQRIKQLEQELEQSMKKFSTKGLTNRLYSYNSSANKTPISRASSNTSKQSNNSKNTSNSAPSMRNRTYNSSNGSQGYQRNTSSQNKPIKQQPLRQQVPIRQQQQRIQAVKKPSPVVQKSPPPRVVKQSPLNQRNYSYNKAPVTNQKNTYNNQRISPVRQNQSPKQPITYLNKPKIQAPTYQKAKVEQKVTPAPQYHSVKVQNYQKRTDLDNKINNLKTMLQQAKK